MDISDNNGGGNSTGGSQGRAWSQLFFNYNAKNDANGNGHCGPRNLVCDLAVSYSLMFLFFPILFPVL